MSNEEKKTKFEIFLAQLEQKEKDIQEKYHQHYDAIRDISPEVMHTIGKEKDCAKCEEIRKMFEEMHIFEKENIGINREEAKTFPGMMKFIRGVVAFKED